MILGTTATHALRAIAHLAAADGAGPTLGRELARLVEVPPDYLAKILAALARTGVLTATRGVRGGYRLARPAREIRLVEVVEPFEGKRVRPGCLLAPGRTCRGDGACSAHAAWSEVKTAYLGFLERTTVADIQGVALPSSVGSPPASPRRAPRRTGAARRPRRAHP